MRFESWPLADFIAAMVPVVNLSETFKAGGKSAGRSLWVQCVAMGPQAGLSDTVLSPYAC